MELDMRITDSDRRLALFWPYLRFYFFLPFRFFRVSAFFRDHLSKKLIVPEL
jgi:hypothetical protein